MSLFGFFGKKKNESKENLDSTLIDRPHHLDVSGEDDQPTRLASDNERNDSNVKASGHVISNVLNHVPSIDHLPDIDDTAQRQRRQNPPETPFTDIPDLSDPSSHERTSAQPKDTVSELDDRTVVLPRKSRRLEHDMGHLIIYKGSHQKKMFSFSMNDSIIIGTREDCLVNLSPDKGVSRHHSRIYGENDVFYIQDLASTNGTLVNDREVEKEVLSDGDRILIGETILLFKWTSLNANLN